MPHLLDQLDEQLTVWLASQGQPTFRLAQIRRWLFERRAESWQTMTDLPQKLRQALAGEFSLWSSQVALHTQAVDGTEKLLLQLPDRRQIECVLLRDGLRRTLCISTQVGCAMGCVFCASGLDGVERNLTSGEILEQMLRLQRLLGSEERVSHIVVMGMGEPLANLDSLLPALDEARREDGLGISARRITISTVGLPQAMRRLAEECPRYRLAVSLHAPNDTLRNQLVPINAKVGLDAVLQEADNYFAASGRRLTFEYVLLGGVNDRAEHARQLARLLAGRPALLNLIPYNPVSGLPYKTPSPEDQQRFRQVLEGAGIAVRSRHRKGDKIDAACGQLRRRSVTRLGSDEGSQPQVSR